jgi:hypothetical protein
MTKLKEYFSSQFFLDFFRLSLIPAIIIPLWLVGISFFSPLGALPLGTSLLAIASIVLTKKYRAAFSERPVVVEISTKLIMMCCSSLLISVAFLLFQIGVWIWAEQFSPTIQQLSDLFNKLPSKHITEISKNAALVIRIGLVLSLALTFALAPLLSAKVAKFSRGMSRAIDAATIALLTANLFLIYGTSPAGLNAVGIVLRTEQSDISSLYRNAIAKASEDILAQSIRNALAAANQATQPAQSPASPPSSTPPGGPGGTPPGGGTDGPSPPKPQTDPRMTLNSWENTIYDNVVIDDRRHADEIARNTSRQTVVAAHSKPEGLAPEAANKNALREFRSIVVPSGGPDTHVPNSESVEQMVKVAFDAIELPAVLQSTITQLSNETIVGESVKDVVELFSDAVFQDGLRAVAAEMVNEFLSGSLRASQVNIAIGRYASKFLETSAGEKLKAKVQSIRNYSARIVERITSYRNDRSDPVLKEAEQRQVVELQRLVRNLVVMPDKSSFTVISVEQLKRSSGQITDELIEKLTRANIQQRTDVLARLKLQASTAGTSVEKAKAAGRLYSVARNAGIIAASVGLCSCVDGRTGAVLYSFFTEKQNCRGAC